MKSILFQKRLFLTNPNPQVKRAKHAEMGNANIVRESYEIKAFRILLISNVLGDIDVTPLPRPALENSLFFQLY